MWSNEYDFIIGPDHVSGYQAVTWTSIELLLNKT